MRVAIILAVSGAIMLACLSALRAGPGDGPDVGGQIDDDFQMLEAPGFRVIPLQEAVSIASQRFRGRLIAARLMPPRPTERARGVDLVHELKFLTRQRDVLVIRLDARTGAFLEVAGPGMTAARRNKEDTE